MGGEARISDYGDLQVDQLRFMAARHPDEDAYVDLVAGEGLTFAEWDARSNRLARGLAARGIAPGDRVSIYLPNEESLRWIVAYAAVHKAGAIAVPTNTRLSTRELVVVLGHAEVAAMLTCDELLPARASCAAACRRCGCWSRRRRRATTSWRGTTHSTATRPTSASTRRSTTSPTSCTRRARRACPRAWACGTATCR